MILSIQPHATYSVQKSASTLHSPSTSLQTANSSLPHLGSGLARTHPTPPSFACHSSHTQIYHSAHSPNSSHLMNRIHALNASHHFIHQLQRGSHLCLVLSHGSLHGELHCFSLRTSDCHLHEAFSLAIGNKEFVFERLEGQQLGQRQKARFLAKPAAPENKHVSKCFVYTQLSLF